MVALMMHYSFRDFPCLGVDVDWCRLGAASELVPNQPKKYMFSFPSND